MSTYLIPLERKEFFLSPAGLPTWIKEDDEILLITLDWLDKLDGETISTSAWTDNGVTTSSASNTTTTASMTVTKTDGYSINKITTSGGRTLWQRAAFVSPSYVRRDRDYGR